MKRLLISVSLICLVIGASFITVYANYSETFPLSPMTSIVRNVELQKDDRLVGSFTINNLQTWKDFWGDTVSYTISVEVKDPKGQVVLSYTKTKGDSFDYTAFYSGVYTFRFGCGISKLPPSGIENPEATLNYNVISPSQAETSTFFNLSNWENQLFVGIVIVGIIVITCLFLYNKKNK